MSIQVRWRQTHRGRLGHLCDRRYSMFVHHFAAQVRRISHNRISESADDAAAPAGLFLRKRRDVTNSACYQVQQAVPYPRRRAGGSTSDQSVIPAAAAPAAPAIPIAIDVSAATANSDRLVLCPGDQTPSRRSRRRREILEDDMQRFAQPSSIQEIPDLLCRWPSTGVQSFIECLL